MKNILVLTDFSESAEAAEKFALWVAIKIRANLILYNAYPEPTSFAANGTLVWPHAATVSLELVSISNLESRVIKLREELEATGPNVYHPVISHLGESGSLTKELDHVINKNAVCMVVMGTKGEDFAGNLFMGSHVYRVLEACSKPVLIVPHGHSLKAMKNIMYATDLKSDDAHLIDWLKEWAKNFCAELLVEHVVANVMEEEVLEDKNLNAEILFPGSRQQPEIGITEGSNIPQTLLRLLEEKNAGMLAMRYRKHGFMEHLFHVSNTHSLIRHTQIPVLIFPENHP